MKILLIRVQTKSFQLFQKRGFMTVVFLRILGLFFKIASLVNLGEESRFVVNFDCCRIFCNQQFKLFSVLTVLVQGPLFPDFILE